MPRTLKLALVCSLGALFSAAATVEAGSVDFILLREEESALSSNYRAQAAIESMFGQFEQTLRTSGRWNATIEVFVTDNETSAYASASPGSYEVVDWQQRQYWAANAWVQIVQGVDDPNGAAQPGGAGRDILVNWNFNLSLPENNPGLLRHELMHGLGMLTSLPSPRMSPDGVVKRPRVGQETTAQIYDRALHDANGNPLLAGYNGAFDRHVLADYAVDGDWGDANESGIVFRGIADDGTLREMTMNSWAPDGSSQGGVDFSHITEVSYVFARNGDWNFINEADRAFFRGMGYDAVAPNISLPDYNQDSVVNAADYVVWRNAFGTQHASADGDNSGAVNMDDFILWRQHYGIRDDHSHLASMATHIDAPAGTGGAISSANDVDWFQFAATMGTNYLIRPFAGSLANPLVELFLDDGTTTVPFNQTWQAPEDGSYRIRVASADGNSFGSYGLSIEIVAPDDHADGYVGATMVVVPGTTAGEITPSGDVDWFAFDALGGERYRLETTLGTLRDSVLYLYDTDGTTQVAFNDDINLNAGVYASRIDWTAPSDGTYYARVTGYASQTGTYSLEVGGVGQSAAVPEPSSAPLLLAAMVSIAGSRRRREFAPGISPGRLGPYGACITRVRLPDQVVA